MTEHWIWSNQRRGWWRANERGYTNLLHEAGRYSEAVAEAIVKKCNFVQAAEEWPNEVAIPVTEAYVFPAGRKLLDEFRATGDREVLDQAYFAAQDRIFTESEAFQESLGQMLRGEGREVDLDRLTERGNDDRAGD